MAYATRSTDQTAALFSVLGFSTVIHRRRLDKFNVFVSKMRNAKGDVVEIVEPTGDGRSPVDALLRSGKTAIYHVCHKVKNLAASQLELQTRGAVVITKPFENALFPGYQSAHLYHPWLGVFELFSEQPA